MHEFNRLSTREKRETLSKTQTDAEAVLCHRLRGKGFTEYKLDGQYGIGD